VTSMESPDVTDAATGQPQTVRGGQLDLPDWLALPVADRYAAATRKAVKARRQRAAEAAAATINLAGQLAENNISAPDLPGDPMWEVRGEPRTRATFGLPHPGDFIGTGQTPAEFPQEQPTVNSQENKS
jgi:hypothetical protein